MTLFQLLSAFSQPLDEQSETQKTVRFKRSITPKTVDEPRSRSKKVFCKVCQSSIVKEGGRSQGQFFFLSFQFSQFSGARRHLLQHHIKKSLYRCKVCDYTSNYDKGHVKAHIRRIHQGVGEVESLKSDEDEEKLWMELCFGKEDFLPGRGLIQNGGFSSSSSSSCGNQSTPLSITAASTVNEKKEESRRGLQLETP